MVDRLLCSAVVGGVALIIALILVRRRGAGLAPPALYLLTRSRALIIEPTPSCCHCCRRCTDCCNAACCFGPALFIHVRIFLPSQIQFISEETSSVPGCGSRVLLLHDSSSSSSPSSLALPASPPPLPRVEDDDDDSPLRASPFPDNHNSTITESSSLHSSSSSSSCGFLDIFRYNEVNSLLSRWIQGQLLQFSQQQQHLSELPVTASSQSQSQSSFFIASGDATGGDSSSLTPSVLSSVPMIDHFTQGAYEKL